MAGLRLPAISETEISGRLSESETETDEIEISVSAQTGGETSELLQKRKKYFCSYRKEYNKRFP